MTGPDAFSPPPPLDDLLDDLDRMVAEQASTVGLLTPYAAVSVQRAKAVRAYLTARKPVPGGAG